MLPAPAGRVIRRASRIRPATRNERRARRAYARGPMETLARRLSQLDPHAEGGLRVVMFFDTLMRRRVSLPALARAAAGLAECGIGIRLHGTSREIRMAPDGRPAPAPPPPPSTTAPVTLDEEEIGTVWLERPGRPGPLDELTLDRLAIAVAAVVERSGPARTIMADPALVELAVSASSDDAARSRALRLMGFDADLPVRAVAARSPVPLNEVARLLCPARPVKAAPLGDVGVILATGVDRAALPAGVRAGVGGAGRPERSWGQARTALRFASARDPLVCYDDLGSLALLAEVPRAVAQDNADVAAVALMAADTDLLETLEAYCATGSLRQAAERLHLHHSSVARRLEHIERTLGLSLSEPSGLMRASLAVTAWRLLDD